MGFPGITREPGESEEDFARRYSREKQRFYRAQKPKSTRKRGKGKGPAANGNLTREEWEALQPQPGEADEDHRRRYAREMMRRHRQKDPAHAKRVRLAHYAANRDKVQATASAWRDAHPDSVAASQRKYLEANREKRAAATKVWIAANPEIHAAAKARWEAANKPRLASYAAKWRRAARNATPAWADHGAILKFYEEAQRLTLETGIPHHVDHIVPLQGKTVCGLHVQTNLRVITGSENSRKRNKLDEVLLAQLFDDHSDLTPGKSDGLLIHTRPRQGLNRRDSQMTEDNGPALSVTGVKRAHGARAVKWLANRSLLAFYRRDGSLNAFVFKGGRDATYKALNDALDATR